MAIEPFRGARGGLRIRVGAVGCEFHQASTMGLWAE
jgi:hypothetical protein